MDNNGYVRRVALYSELDEYNLASQFGPKLPPTVPSNKFPTLLDSTTKQSYSVLTYDNSPHTYPTVDSAYTYTEPKYFVGKCPDNSKVRDFGRSVVPQPTPNPIQEKQSCNVVNEPINEGFKHIDYNQSLKDLDILLFIDKKCSFSREQLKQKLIDNMQIMDIKKRKNKQLFTDYGGFATPYFYSTKTNRGMTGFEKNEKKIYDSLYVVEHFTPSPKTLPEKMRELDIVIYSSKQCPYCMLLYRMLNDNNVLEEVTIIEDVSKMKNVDSIQGFPFIFSQKTGKKITGVPQDLHTLTLVLQEDEKPLRRTNL